ncbi:pilus assembly protein [Pseudactinotalea sp. Z1748]|uniref:pilus assembly protein n=1 Tax=Pseudactinotalea sp. Z1748 TaxID=3413027 RepID=UPI003C7D75AD
MTCERWDLRRAWAGVCSRLGERERGSAVVEFLGVSLLMLVPVVYLILTLAQIQASGFAAEGAAREAGRVLAGAETFEQGLAAAHLAVELSFADQGISVDGAQALRIRCQDEPCLTPGSYLYISVRTDVDLPGLPPIFSGTLPSVTQVQADAMTTIPRYREVG